ncbi:serine/threonine-protein kinase [Micromonosporaceae bacterium Da 78-11]
MSTPLRPGEDARLGRYELLGRLGQGGMGAVYLAQDDSGRQVAIKMVRPEFSHDEEFRARFRSEVTRARQVPPFSTAEVLDADPDHDPPYLVVEYVDGPSLARVIQDRGPLSGSSLHGVAVGIATALTAIHGAGVIHRDLKPGNVLVAMGGIKVIDFGIARAFEATSQHTATDQMVGTVAYMAPERFETDADRPVGPAADIFSWGAVVTYAATGRTPFATDSATATAVRILTQPPDLTGVPASLRGLVEASLAKDPRERPTARQLLDLLLDAATPVSPAAYQAAAVVSAPPAPVPPPVDAPPRNRRRLKMGVAAGVVFALVLAAGVFRLGPFGDDPADPAAGPQASTAPASAQPSSAAVDVHAMILRGSHRTLIHVSELDRDLALDLHGEKVEVAGGTGDKSLFALVPVGVDYLIRTLRDPDEDDDNQSCLGVKLDPEASGTLVAAECAATKATIFSLSLTGQKDDKGRPTYHLSNDAYGVVLWSAEDRTVVVSELGDAEPNLSVSFVDRGPV